MGPAFTAWASDVEAVELPGERYEVVGELGRGGMGVVEVVYDRWLDREVARKRPRPDLPDIQERLAHEARITARLDHPGVTPVLDFGTDADGPFYTMPVIDGVTLEQALRERPIPALVRVLLGVCQAVAYAHARGIVHRDLKPANIAIGSFGEVRVMDWGVALDPLAPDDASVGTDGYRAPEVGRRERATARADVYALGRILGQLETDDAELTAIARRAAAEAAGERYPDAAALASDLERWLEGARVEAHAYTQRELVVRMLRAWRAPLLVAAGVGTLALAMSLGWATTNGWERDRARAAERRAEHARLASDRSLAAALGQTAGAYLLADARPQAEVLAAAAAALADEPAARGVFAAFHGASRPERLSSEPACTGVPAPDGRVLCVEGASFHGPGIQGTMQDGEPIYEARWDDDLVALIHTRRTLELWESGRRRSVHMPVSAHFGSGARTLLDRARVGWIEDAETIRWSLPVGCARLQQGWSDGDRFAAVCAAGAIVSGTLSAGPQQRWNVAHPLSAVAIDRHGNLVAGSFDGFLFTTANGLREEPSGVGPVSRIDAFGEGVVVTGERLTPVLWDARGGAVVGRLPRNGGLAPSDDGLHLVGDGVHERWAWPTGPVARLQRGGDGGLSFLDVEGDRLLGGNSLGEVSRWSPAGAHVWRTGPCSNVAKSGALLTTGREVFSRIGCAPALWEHGPDGPLHEWSLDPARDVVRWGEGFAAIDYADRLRWVVDGTLQQVTAQAEVMDAAADVWVARRNGWLARLEEGELVERIQARADELAVWSEGFVLADGGTVRSLDLEGVERWRWEGTSQVTRLDATPDWVVVGDRDGRVRIFDADGILLGVARGHERRVSDVVIEGDVAWTASWDGSIRRWGLEATRGPLPVVDWGLALETVLALPPP